MRVKDPLKVAQGRKNRAAGARFEGKVRKYLEAAGNVVAKWQNNVDLHCNKCNTICKMKNEKALCVQCNAQLLPGEYTANGFCAAKGNRFLMRSTGFPDFVVINPEKKIYFVESKSNGRLKPEEKEKIRWIKTQGYDVIIAKKGDDRGEIEWTQ